MENKLKGLDLQDYFELEYVDNLAINNYKDYQEGIIRDTSKIMSRANLSISTLSKFSKISRPTMIKLLNDPHCNLSFNTVSKLNNFIRKIAESVTRVVRDSRSR